MIAGYFYRLGKNQKLIPFCFFAFTKRNISDLLNFAVILLDGDGKEIKFPANEKNLPIINFQIQIVKNGE